MELILASGSPRRLELLHQIGIFPRVIVSHSEEETADVTPEELVRHNALVKGRDVVRRTGDAVPVLSADTVVVLEHRVLGKPGTEEKAKAMLRLLSGKTHQVLTGMALFYKGRVLTHVETTDVTLSTLTEQDIEAYAATGEPLDKAGAYGIQGRAAAFIPRIQGSYSNVVGLPLAALKNLIAELDVTGNEPLSHQGNDSGRTTP